jgi:hypothetical protein
MQTLIPRSGYVVFTTGDLVEGLSFLKTVERRATVFGMEQRLPARKVVALSRTAVTMMPLTDLARSMVDAQVPHPKLPYLFWTHSQDGKVMPLLDLEAKVRTAFGGMSWSDLQAAYTGMVQVDAEAELRSFRAAFATCG